MISKRKRSQHFTSTLEDLLENLPYLYIIILKKKNNKQKELPKQNNQKTTLNLENFKHWDPSLKSQLLQTDKRNRAEINDQSCVGNFLFLLSAFELYGYYCGCSKLQRLYLNIVTFLLKKETVSH